MQLSPGRHPFRYRGYRQSAPLVDLIRAPAVDFKSSSGADYDNQTTYLTTRGYVDSLSDEQVSKLQAIRTQIRYRLKAQD